MKDSGKLVLQGSNGTAPKSQAQGSPTCVTYNNIDS